MNQTIHDGVHAVRAAGHKVLDRVESAADEVRTEARGAQGKLTRFGKRNRKRDHKRGRIAGLTASATSVIAFVATYVVRRRRHQREP
ncbi:MAG: hypothetical protein HOV87_35105 [Catenulispora sp.]|nr:hypothetical protein [Catenulispora sp.]